MLSVSKKRSLIALLGAISLFFAAIEFLFPKPLPFMRLGLANIPILLALELLTFPELLLLALLKVVGQAIINGTLASYVSLFSLVGTIGSLLIMVLLHRLLKQHISLVGISMAGSLTSNLVQMLLSVTFIFGRSSLMIMPVFLTVGTISGLIMGLLALRFAEKSSWYGEVRELYGR